MTDQNLTTAAGMNDRPHIERVTDGRDSTCEQLRAAFNTGVGQELIKVEFNDDGAIASCRVTGSTTGTSRARSRAGCGCNQLHPHNPEHTPWNMTTIAGRDDLH